MRDIGMGVAEEDEVGGGWEVEVARADDSGEAW